MRLIIAGSRDFNNYPIMAEVIDKQFISIYGIPTLVVSGGARGADSLGEHWAKNNNIKIEQYIPNWEIGRHAGILRNAEMAKNADALIAFWDGSSHGTKNMIDTAKMKNLIVVVVNVSTNDIQHFNAPHPEIVMG